MILYLPSTACARTSLLAEAFNGRNPDRTYAVDASKKIHAVLELFRIMLIVKKASEALEEVGIYAKGRRARQVSQTLLEEADLVVAMTPRHVAELRRLFGDASHKIYTLPEYAKGAPSEEDISDPGTKAVRTCYIIAS